MKRRATAYRIVQALILVLIIVLLPATVWAQETTLTTVIPSSHTLHIELTGEGTIIVDGVAYTQSASSQVQRQSRPEISLQAADGYKIKTVLWGSEDVTEEFRNGEWTAPEITEDAVLTVTFEKTSSTPQTGDALNLNLCVVLAAFSMLGIAICLLSSKKKAQ